MVDEEEDDDDDDDDKRLRRVVNANKSRKSNWPLWFVSTISNIARAKCLLTNPRPSSFKRISTSSTVILPSPFLSNDLY